MDPAALTLHATIADLAGRLHDGDLEEHFVIDHDGRILSHLVGTASRLDAVMNIPAETLEGRITVHQHPGAALYPISENDIVNGLACGVRATFVVAPDMIHRWTSRYPDPDERELYGDLLDLAESLTTRSAARIGWSGPWPMPPEVFARFRPVFVAATVALAAAYPEFATYARLPLDTPAAGLLP